MFYVCGNCREAFDEDDTTVNELRTNYDEPRAYEELCPHCGESVCCDEPAYQCANCGSWFAEEELKGSVCNECLDEIVTLENALTAGAEQKQAVKLNGFIAEHLTVFEIEKKCMELIKEDFEITPERVKRAVKNYANGDIDWFCDFVIKAWEEKE